MNPNLQVNNAGGERFITPSGNPGPRPAGMIPYNNPQQVRPQRMESPRPNSRSENSYQPSYPQQNPSEVQNNMQAYQQQQQQNIIQQNHQRQLNMQQQNLRFPPSGNSPRPQTNLPYNPQPNGSVQDYQRGPGGPFEGPRAQLRFPGPQQPARPPVNNPNGAIASDQPNLQNYQRMETPRPSDWAHPENYKTQIIREPPLPLSRKTSELDMMLNSSQKPSEAAGKPQTQIGQPARNSELQKEQIPESELDELMSENDETKTPDSDNNNKVNSADIKAEKKKRVENKNDRIKDEAIISGTVQKNIKFFEENDTAKTPLIPERVIPKKAEKIAQVPKDVVRSEAGESEYESGVDESPVVHPNLGSIFQAPRKVAKIPRIKRSRKSRAKRFSEDLLKRKQHRTPTLSEFLKAGHSYLPYKMGYTKSQKTKIYGSKEELLAFFENTKSWRKVNRYASKSDQNAAKDKLVHKPTTNGDIPTPKKTPSKLQTPSKKNPPSSPTKTPLKSPGTPGTPGPKFSLPKTPESSAPPTPLIKKVPMNKIQVGAAPSPNLKTVRSKVGSLANTTHKPGGGNVKIESHKIDLSKVQPRTEAKNEMYKPSGGEKKIQQVKLQWNAQSKVGSLENATYKPGGGDKKIESVKLDFKEKAKPKVGSKDNVKHVPGGGNVKISDQKLEFKAQSKVGSLDNVKHKPGGGDIKIFDDKTYLRQISANSSEGRGSGTQACRDLSVVREIEGRSAPGTPGRKTSVKIKKVTTIENSGESPKVKKITKVTVTSHTPKKETSSTKQEVKVTYTKMSSSKKEDDEIPVGIMRLPAKEDAPILKPSLRQKDLFNDSEIGKPYKENENKTFSNIKVKMTDNLKPYSASPNLPEGKSNRDDAEISRFYQEEITQEKIGEIWREKNTSISPNIRQREEHQKEVKQTYNSDSEDTQRQFRPECTGGIQVFPNESRHLNFPSNQNLQSNFPNY